MQNDTSELPKLRTFSSTITRGAHRTESRRRSANEQELDRLRKGMPPRVTNALHRNYGDVSDQPLPYGRGSLRMEVGAGVKRMKPRKPANSCAMYQTLTSPSGSPGVQQS